MTGVQTCALPICASSGAACDANADELQIEGSGNAGMTICSGTSSKIGRASCRERV